MTETLVAIAAGLFGLIVGIEIGIRHTAARYRRRLGGMLDLSRREANGR